MAIKKYEDFIKEEAGIRKALIGGAIGAASLLNPSYSIGQERPDTALIASKAASTEDFAKELESERPELFSSEDARKTGKIDFGKFERLSFLKEQASIYEHKNRVRLDLDMLSSPKSAIPFRINYFYVRGLDNIDTGPLLIQILNLDFNAAMKLGGHEVMFNFTRITGVNTLGAKIAF